jgi:predicted DNA-binding transcriptional regulator AlpA
MDEMKICDRLLKESEVFQLLNIGESTGQQWRLKGLGPRFIKIGKSVRYRESDVKSYIESLPTYQSTSQVNKERV